VPALKLVSWNIGHRPEPWRHLLDSGADVALLQEAAAPPPDVASRIKVDAEPWQTEGKGKSRPWRTAIVPLSDTVQVEWHKPIRLHEAADHQFAVSRLGTLSAAVVTAPDTAPLLVVSMYGVWEKPLQRDSRWIYADASAHRLVSDLSALIGRQDGHRIVAAGDLNILNGYGEEGSAYWGARYASVFSRMSAIGVPFVGPQLPNGRCAEPWPAELPRDSCNVPTYHTGWATPATAARQLDFVFASASLCQRVQVRAQNEPERWGPSDHCRVEIEVE
jgi:hypothetical protein